MWWKKIHSFLRHKTKFLSVLRMLEIPWHMTKSGSINSQKPLAKYPGFFFIPETGDSLFGRLTVMEKQENRIPLLFIVSSFL